MPMIWPWWLSLALPRTGHDPNRADSLLVEREKAGNQRGQPQKQERLSNGGRHTYFNKAIDTAIKEAPRDQLILHTRWRKLMGLVPMSVNLPLVGMNLNRGRCFSNVPLKHHT